MDQLQALELHVALMSLRRNGQNRSADQAGAIPFPFPQLKARVLSLPLNSLLFGN